ncbi:MAG: hypothetical protein P8L85_02870 [Rubripirellula sp.]|nr:hypothetical protein [Rubripirellula sp.]
MHLSHFLLRQPPSAHAGKAKVVVVGFGAQRRDPVESIAGNRNRLQPLANTPDNEIAITKRRAVGNLFAMFSGEVKFMDQSGFVDTAKESGVDWAGFSFWTDLSFEPYHAGSADDAKTQHRMLTKSNLPDQVLRDMPITPPQRPGAGAISPENHHAAIDRDIPIKPPKR